MASGFAVAQCGQVMTDSRIMVLANANERGCCRSALRAGRIARVRCRLHKRIHLYLAIIEGHNRRLIFEGHDDSADARHGLEARFHGARAKGAGHMLNRECDGFISGEHKRREGQADPESG
jgi:hypothetical protein